MRLDGGKTNCSYFLDDLEELPLEVGKRLEALGMTRGTEIHILNNKDNGTMIVKVRGTRFAIGKDISRMIKASPAQE
ncbi:MAG: ferrous iron transport protein A [Planctomycetota bacterium]|jgi:ferrous iron transport protein A|nr:ferrous iron transport protein A [Planctomycetota bacterium]